ncbi:kelch-like protein 12 [Amphiura filiformis]|uniref:kelch-like protein 12 n=1 Tax=Amphiura filiformis TaxID=82378 RepID=UPI003B21DF8C
MPSHSSHSKYTSKLAGALNDLCVKQNQLCDIIINVGGKAFHAHKNVLAARNEYFQAMFTSGFREATESEVNIDGKAEIFEVLLEYVYTGKMKITRKTACDLLVMACYMQFKDISLYCSDYIQKKYTSSSCTDEQIPIGDVFKIYEMACFHDHLEILAHKSEEHMCTYFQKLKSSDVFLQSASVEFLKKFLRRTDLSSKDEETEVLDMVVQWLKLDWENRSNFALTLLKKVRLGLVPKQNLTELLDAEILQIPECRQLFQEVCKRQSSKCSAYKLSQNFPCQFATRSIITAPIRICAPKGRGTDTTSFYYFNIKTKQWKSIRSIPPLKLLPSLIVVDDTLYAAGGYEVGIPERSNISDRYEYNLADSDSDYSESEDSVGYDYSAYKDVFQRYDPEQNSWCSLPPLRAARAAMLVHLNGTIYDQHDYYEYALETKRYEIWVYNPNKNEWQSKFSEPDNTTDTLTQPVLVVHKDQCYRVVFRIIPRGDETDYLRAYRGLPKEEQAVVNLLKLRSSRSDVMSGVSLGEEIKQDFIEPNTLGAFRIGEDVFVTTCGDVQQTDLKIHKDEDEDIDLGKWKRFAKPYKRGSNIVNFTCDWKN